VPLPLPRGSDLCPRSLDPVHTRAVDNARSRERVRFGRPSPPCASPLPLRTFVRVDLIRSARQGDDFFIKTAPRSSVCTASYSVPSSESQRTCSFRSFGIVTVLLSWKFLSSGIRRCASFPTFDLHMLDGKGGSCLELVSWNHACLPEYLIIRRYFMARSNLPARLPLVYQLPSNVLRF